MQLRVVHRAMLRPQYASTGSDRLARKTSHHHEHQCCLYPAEPHSPAINGPSSSAAPRTRAQGIRAKTKYEDLARPGETKEQQGVIPSKSGNVEKDSSPRPAMVSPTPAQQRRVRVVAPYLSGLKPERPPYPLDWRYTPALGTSKPIAEAAPEAKERPSAAYGQAAPNTPKPEQERPAPREERIRAPLAVQGGQSEPPAGTPSSSEEQATSGRDLRAPSSSAGIIGDHKRGLAADPARTRESTDRQGLIPVQVEILDQHDMPVQWLAYIPEPDLTLKYSFVEQAKSSGAHTGEKIEAPAAPLQPVKPTKEQPPLYRIVVRVIPAGDLVNLEARLVHTPSGIEKQVLTRSQIPREKADEAVKQLVRSLLNKT